MTVKELIAKLQQHHEDRLVVVSKDAEGNGFSPLDEIQPAAYQLETTWSGQIGLEPSDLTDEKRAKGFTEEDVLHGQPALVLWPAN